ncbi:MAG: thioredoxin family protein [Gemmatales bacterium]|nr:thioredoxin family protein [Gemmatales bacterium]
MLRRCGIVGCVVLGWAMSAFGQGAKPTPVEGKIRWVYDYEEGKRLARQSGKPMFVVLRCER